MAINFEAILKEIGIPHLKSSRLLEIALIHPFYLNERLNSLQISIQEREYRRLAILGDSILGTTTIDYLYSKYPNADQKFITEFKNKIVTREQAGKFAIKLKLKQLCLLGNGEVLRHESEQIKLFGEMFEALLGAIYLGLERDFITTKSWLVDRFIRDFTDDLFDVQW